MKKDKFKSLTSMQKLLIIMESGRLIMEKKEEDVLTKLYVYQQFFVEIAYETQQNKVKRIRTPEIEEVADEYLGSLNVNDILNM